MKLLWPLITLFCLGTRVLSALSPEQLLDLQGPDGIIRLNDDNFNTVVNGAREYYISLLFSALSPDIACSPCVKFEPVYAKIARSYINSNPGKNAVFFVEADFSQNQNIFNTMNMKQVPRLMLFPPTKDQYYNATSPHFPYKIGDRAISDPLDFANFISKIVNVNIVVQEEFDPLQFAQYFIGTFLFVLILKKKVLARLARGAIFRGASVISICILTGGYMFTVIRSIPLIMKNDKGELMHFSGGTHWQFGLETFIIAGIYLMFTLLISGLVIKIPLIEDPKRKSFATMFAAFGIFWLFNTLTKIFLIKDPGYPYRLTELL